MMNILTRRQLYTLLLIIGILPLTVYAQQPPTAADTLAAQSDSLVSTLRAQIQELQLQGVMMKEQLERNGIAARNDSLMKARRRARIDSLRQITPGVPLVVEGDTLFVLYNRRGGESLEARVADIREHILTIGKSLSLFADSVYVYEGDLTTDVMGGEEVIMSLTELDGLWQNKTRQELAAEYRGIIEAKINQLHAEYGLRQKLLGVLYVFGIVLLMGCLIGAVNWCYRHWRYRLLRRLLRRTQPLTIKDYEVLNLHRQGIVFLTCFNVLRYVAILLLLLFFIPLLFSVFPETKSFT